MLDYWAAQIHYQKIGARFYTLGNLGLPGDVSTSRAFFQGGKGGLSIDAQWAEEENNVDANRFLPTQTLSRKNLTINYSPMMINPDNRIWSTVGSPSVILSHILTQHSQSSEDIFVAGYDLNNQVAESALTLMFSRPQWNWSMQYQVLKHDERTQEVSQNGYLIYQPPSDVSNRLAALQLGWLPSERVSVNASMQWNTRMETDFDNDFRNRNISIDTFFQIVPGKLTAHINYNLGKNWSRLSHNALIEDDMENQFGNAQFSWHAFKMQGENPGLDVYLRGNYGKLNNRAYAQVTEQWSVHLGINLFWGTEQ
jgi:hypothetical protein